MSKRVKKIHLLKQEIVRRQEYTVCGLSRRNARGKDTIRVSVTIKNFLAPVASYYKDLYPLCKKCYRHPDVGMELLRRESMRK